MNIAELRAWLTTLADAEATVPAREILRRLPPTDANDAHGVGGDMTLDEVATEVGRAVGTIRTWCNSKRIDGAYRLNGRDWRIPQAALRKFLDAQGRGETQDQVRNGDADWDDWRQGHA